MSALRVNQKSWQGPQTLKVREHNHERLLAEAGRSPGRIRYALTVVSEVWSMVAERGLVSGEIRSRSSKSRA